MSGSGFKIYCGFCGKAPHEAAHLIAGPTVAICDECTWQAVEILESKGFNRPIANLSAETREINTEQTP